MARIPRTRTGLALALLLGLTGCETYDSIGTLLLPDLFTLPKGAFEQAAVAPKGHARARFLAGHQAFVAACGACHRGDDRGAPVVAGGVAGGEAGGEVSETAILRLSPPDPNYGARLDHRGGPDTPVEARAAAAYRILAGRFPDGETYELRLPRNELSDFAAGPLAEGTSVSLRAAPPVIGTGLIAGIEEAALRARADPEDRDGDGISGRLGTVAGGRFGWKAASGLTHATGFSHDGLTAPPGEADELAEYLNNLDAPYRRNLNDPRVRRGGAVFATAGCATCHAPRAVARATDTKPETEFYPYSDFLLHDMGKGLADPGSGPEAREWRSAPLWGLGRTGPDGTAYLHDGRARNLIEAILWHGGEARAARKKVRALPREDRAALIAFLKSL